VSAHPPERRRVTTVTLPCGCCCCCCCCLHTIGGLIGAGLASGIAGATERPRYPDYYYHPEDYPGLVLPPRRSPTLSAVAIYWITFAGLTTLTAVLSCMGYGGGPTRMGSMEGAGAALLILAIFLPAVQLAASVLAIILAAVTDLPNAGARVWAVGKITLGMVLGTAVGMGIMVVLYVGLTAR
jgi:hypothetical protein